MWTPRHQVASVIEKKETTGDFFYRDKRKKNLCFGLIQNKLSMTNSISRATADN
jgi:hypothetical protein